MTYDPDETIARHFRVVFLSNLYIVRICMRDFFREIFQDCCHMYVNQRWNMPPSSLPSSEPSQTPSVSSLTLSLRRLCHRPNLLRRHRSTDS
jgi:hypothetical protein